MAARRRKIPVTYNFGVDDSEVKKKFAGFRKIVEDSKKGVSAFNKSITAGVFKGQLAVDALKKGWQLLSRAIARVLGFMKRSIELSGQQQLVMTQLTSALQRAGVDGARVAAKEFEAFAGVLQKQTGIGDETIISAASVAASMGLTGQQLQRTTKAGLDLSVALGKDLKGSMLLLGKAFKGETGSLSEAGIIIDKTLPKAEQFEAALRAIEGSFGDAAEAAGQTFTGRVAGLTSAWGDLQERLGDAVTNSKLINSIILLLTQHIANLGGWIAENANVIQQWVQFGWLKAVGAAKLFVQAGALVLKFFKGLQVAGSGALHVLAVVFQKLAEVIEFTLIRRFDDVAKWITRISKGAVRIPTIGDAFAKVKDKVDTLVESTKELAGEQVKDFDNIGVGAERLIKKIEEFGFKVIKTSGSIQIGIRKGVVEPIEDAGNKVEELKHDWEDLAKIWGRAVGEILSGNVSILQGLKNMALQTLEAMERVVVAQAVQAASKQASSLAWIPPPAGPPLMAAAATAAFALVKGLLSLAKFAQGGLVGGPAGMRSVVGGVPGTDSVLGLLQQGEVVLPVPMVRAFSKLFNTRGGAPGGGAPQATPIPRLPGFAAGGMVSAGPGFGTLVVKNDFRGANFGNARPSDVRRAVLGGTVDAVNQNARNGRGRGAKR